MNRYIKLSCICAALTAASIVPQSYAGPPVWENFRGKALNAGRWLGGRVDSGAIELGRFTKDNGLQLRLRGIDDRENTSGGRSRVLNRLWMNAGAAVTARSIQTNVSVNEAETKDCSDSGAADTRSEYRNHSTWFNDGRSAAAGDRLGDVFSYIGLRKTALNALEGNQLEIVALVGVCDDADCDTSTILYADTLGTYTIGNKISWRTTWDENSQIVRFYKKQKGEDAVVLSYIYADDVTATGDPGTQSGELHNIQIRTETADCDLAGSGSERPYGLTDATVWNTRLSESAVGK